jgi:hypothetical protein
MASIAQQAHPPELADTVACSLEQQLWMLRAQLAPEER